MPRTRVAVPAPRATVPPSYGVMFMGLMHLLLAKSGSSDEAVGWQILLLGVHLQAEFIRIDRLHRRSNRYGPRGSYNTNLTKQFIDNIIDKRSNRYFQSWLRVNRHSFFKLLELIENDPVFTSRGRKPQMPPRYQLATYLIRYGALTGTKVSSVLDIAEGTVYNHCRRVTKAFRHLRPLYLTWPTPDERQRLQRYAKSKGFPGAIGAIDGSSCTLLEKPRQNAMSYRTRKKTWALGMQAIVTFKGKFISYDLGWPGSVHDVSMLRNSHFWLTRDEHLNPNEFILGDKGYPVSRYIVTPFPEKELYNNRGQVIGVHKRWNKAHSSMRIAVEHAFGRLKARFPYFSSISSRDLKEAIRVMGSLLVVHNILMSLGDMPDDIPGVNFLAALHEQRARQPLEADFAHTHNPENQNKKTTQVVGQIRRGLLCDYWAARQ